MMLSKVSSLPPFELLDGFRTAQQLDRTRRNRVGILAGPDPVCEIFPIILPKLHGDYRQAGCYGLQTRYSGHGADIGGYGGSEGAERLPVTTGDRWIADADLQRVDYIKIDVEGFEDEVLLGLRETIRRFRPLVSFEYSGQSDDRPSFEVMRSALAGFEIYEPVLEPLSAASAGKILFYLKHALNPEIVPVIEPANRYYPYLIAVPSDRKDRFDLS